MRAAVFVLVLGAPGCVIPSNVVAVDQRAVRTDETKVPFAAPRASDLDGLFVATTIRGPAAASLRHLCYWFAPGGHFSGAALIARDGGNAFQTLSGSWSLAEGRLRLGDNEPARLESAPGWLRLSGDDGTVVVLQRSVER